MNTGRPNCAIGKRVLVVDDNELILNLVDRHLRGEGFDVTTALDGDAAISWCEKYGQPDLLLTDVCMSGIDGPTLAQHLSKQFPRIPVVFMSGIDKDVQNRVIAPFLQKPFFRNQLISMINTALMIEPSQLQDS